MPMALRGTDFVSTFPARIVAHVPNGGFTTFPCPIDLRDLVETLSWHPMADADRGHGWMRALLFDAARALGDPPP